MYCRKCGSPNDEGARFCGKCGAELQPPQEQTEKEKKVKKIRLWAGAAAVLAAAVVLAGYFAMKDVSAREAYEEYMTNADKYLETMDYEKAEEEYLQAIAIDPKQEEPYLKLAQLYEADGETEKAEGILAEADKKVPQKNRRKLAKKKEEDKQAAEQKSNYTAVWETEPQVEADAIYYLAANDYYEQPVNELRKQYLSPYAVIQKGEAKGLIGMDGRTEGGLDYEDIQIEAGGYLMERTEPVYDDKAQGQCSMYRMPEGMDEIEPALGLGGMPPYDVFYESGGELISLLERSGGSFYDFHKEVPDGAFPVQRFETPFEGDIFDDSYREWKENGGLYAVYNGGAPVTDFVYEECGSAADGLLAVKRDGKWGYVDESGKEVIPAEFDASWQYYTSADPYGEAYEDYCYAASEGYVVLRSGKQWELRDTAGNVAVPSGIYEEILPVYEGRCWVKKDGRWGVLEIYEWSEDAQQEDGGGSDEDVQDTGGPGESYTVYDSGPVELTGVIRFETGTHPNGQELQVLLLKLDIPAGFRVGGGAEEEVTYDNCTDIQLFNPISDVDESWDGKHVKVTGNLRGDAHTAYYFRNYVIDNAAVSEIK